MQLLITKDIDNNIFSVTVTIDSFGTSTMTAEEEMDLLDNFPTKITYRGLTFTRLVKVENSIPVIVDSEGEGVIEVTLPALSNKEIVLDKDFNANYKIDTNRIVSSALDLEVLTTKELVAQAYCLVFEDVICTAVADAMTLIRQKAPAFEGTSLIDV